MNNYYNRFNTSQNYEKLLFLAGRGLQSPELNELQESHLDRLKALGDAIFKDGDVVRGGACVIQDGEVTIEEGAIYLKGAVRTVPAAHLTISEDQRIKLGVFLKESTVTELEDPTLRDPAVGTRNYQEPGAYRLKTELTWGAQADGTAPNPQKGDFYPVYVVENGVLVIQSAAPEVDSVTVALARYDRESNGSYVVKGFDVKYQGIANDKQVFVLNEGKAHVDGYEIELPHSVRLTYDLNPDLATVESEPHTFHPDEKGQMRITLNNPTCSSIQAVDITQQKTASLTHGAYSGCSDAIPDQAILEIVAIRQGETIFPKGTAFQLKGTHIEWVQGQDPAPGSSFEVTYRARVKAAPQDVDESGFTVANAVPDTLVLVDYTWKMPRYDLIAIDSGGKIQRIQGQAHAWNPSHPKAPAGQLSLALVHQTWKEGAPPQVTSTAIQAVPMTDLQSMKAAIADLYDAVAEEKLKNDANARDPAAKKGIFVDPFFDDDMRDQGVVQTAAIVDQCLQLPIQAKVIDTGQAVLPWTLPYELTPVISQTLKTGSMKINPYQAFDPMPAKAQMILDTDRWTETVTKWASGETQRFSTSSSSVFTTTTSTVLSTATEEAATLRPLTQKFRVDGFKAGEEVAITFDGIAVEPKESAE